MTVNHAHSPTSSTRPVANISTPVLMAVALMFLLSGASALVYEVVWTRQLTTFFGSTLYGVATVLSAFMGGLALGSFLAGRRVDRLRHPLMVYGALELGIGAVALLFPVLLRATQPLVGAVYTTGGEGTFYLYSLVRFVIVFTLLMVPTTMMGATLPLLSKAITADLARVGRSIGGLYALNTTGAVLGVFAAGFLLLENFGIFHTTLIAVALNAAIGTAAVVLGRRWLVVQDVAVQEAADDEQRDTIETYSPFVMKVVLLTYATSGFVALAYQICWTRALIFSFDRLKATTYSFSGMLVVFLMGLAIGGALMQSIVDRQRNLLRLYGLLQAGIGITGGLSFFALLHDWPGFPEANDDGTLLYWYAVLNVMTKTAMAIGLPTLLMGMAFPVVSKIVVSSIRHVGNDVARVYALNTLGAILGSFAAGFILIPLLGITSTIAVLAGVNLLLAAALFHVNPQLAPNARMGMVALTVVAAVIVPVRLMTSSASFQRLQWNEKMVHYEEGALATVSVIENNSGERMIYVDSVGVAGTDKIMLTDQKSLAHVPMMLLGGEARAVLSVGFGSGGASYSYTLYKDLQEIHTIEIAPEVLRAAPTLTDSNHGIIAPDELITKAVAAGAQSITGFRHPLSEFVHTATAGFKTFDPRFKLLIDDARSYLRFSKVKYDVIATDCTDLRYKSNANLYDLEYFQLCREAITDKGLVVVWMPLAGLNELSFRSALRTFQEVFPEMGVWYFTNQPTHYCLLIGGRGPVRIDYEGVRRAVQLPGVARDLEEIGLADPDKLISSFVCDERTLTKHLAGFPLNTENHPIIEFESPRYGYGPMPIYENQVELFRIQVPAGDLLTNVPPGLDPAPRIWQLQQANAIVFEGHHQYRIYNFPEACTFYTQALAMVPWDDSIARLLDFAELRRHYETASTTPQLARTRNTFWVAHGLASVFLMQGRHMDAATIAEQAAARIPTDNPEYRETAWALNGILARIYKATGRQARAEQYLEEAAKYAGTPEDLARLEAAIHAAE